MEEKLLKIFNTWDASKQLKQLHSEVFELTEAIFERGDKNHICEEIADCYVLLEQFRLFFGISSEDVMSEFRRKVNRTLERIEQGYYDEPKKQQQKIALYEIMVEDLKDKNEELRYENEELKNNFEKYKDNVSENYKMKSPYEIFGISEKDFH